MTYIETLAHVEKTAQTVAESLTRNLRGERPDVLITIALRAAAAMLLTLEAEIAEDEAMYRDHRESYIQAQEWEEQRDCRGWSDEADDEDQDARVARVVRATVPVDDWSDEIPFYF